MTRIFLILWLLVLSSQTKALDIIDYVVDLADFVTCSDNNPWSSCPDHLIVNTAPVISLTGGNVSITEGGSYTEQGATCTDSEDGSITVPAPSFSPTLNTNTAGTYVATYACTDSGSLTDTVTRVVFVNSISADLAFANVTSSIRDVEPADYWYFDTDFMHGNDDGCVDIHLGGHGDGSSMYIQDTSGSTCLGTFSYFENNDNYYQRGNGSLNRITSRWFHGDFNGDGLWDHMGWDADNSDSGIYFNTSTAGQHLPTYTHTKTETISCWSVNSIGQNYCQPAYLLDDGLVDLYGKAGSNDILNPGMEIRSARDVSTGSKFLNTTNGITRSSIVFDVDNDSYPELVMYGDVNVTAANRGWFTTSTGTPQWVGNKFDYTVPTNDQRQSRPLIGDFDNDGDMDLITFWYLYGSSGTIDLNFFRNNGDGTFTEVTNTSGLVGQLSNQAYQTSYSNSAVGDVDNDGYLDILFGSESCGQGVTFLMNNGNMSFTVDRSVNFVESCTEKPRVATMDYDSDGKIDIVKTAGSYDNSVSGQFAIYRNTMNTGNNWFKVKVIGEQENTDGMQTRLTWFEPNTTNIITSTQVYSSAAHNNLNPHVGLGSHTTVDLQVVHPHNGGTYLYEDLPVNQEVIVYFNGAITQNWTPGSGWSITPPVVSNSVDTEVTLIADTDITPTSSELVTFALPFAEGEVTSIDELKVSIAGSEVPAYVESDLVYHWSDNSIRSATIQLQNVDMTSGNVTVTIDDTGFSQARLSMLAHTGGWATSGADKNNLQYPRIFATHDPQYLADSGLIPPYTPAPATPDAFETFVDTQFGWAGDSFNYSTSTRANWLFDRATAHFKHYMTTGEVKYLKEAFLAKQFYFSHVEADGDWGYISGNCVSNGDAKYVYTQPAKLALALVGDHSQWDNTLINNMGIDGAYQCQPVTTDLHDAENEGFTERAAGIAGLAEINAYEITGNATILSNMNLRIASLKAMQQDELSFETANGWTPKSGAFTHSISQHEGDTYPGDGTSNDRGFSPWMTENIVDFLWQAYWITDHADIPEILRGVASAVDQYGFSTQWNGTGYDYRAGFSGARTRSCNTTGADTDILYFGSAFAGEQHLADTHWAYYTDLHNIETVLTLAAGYHFETDNAIRTRLKARIDRLHQGWSNVSCGGLSSTQRAYNWEHRSNSVRTWAFINEGSL